METVLKELYAGRVPRTRVEFSGKRPVAPRAGLERELVHGVALVLLQRIERDAAAQMEHLVARRQACDGRDGAAAELS